MGGDAAVGVTTFLGLIAAAAVSMSLGGGGLVGGCRGGTIVGVPVVPVVSVVPVVPVGEERTEREEGASG